MNGNDRSQRSLYGVAALALAGGLLLGPGHVEAQVPLGESQTIEDMEWNIRNLRPTGMPIIPIFDGWVPNDDGTADLCFGYMSLNLEETRDIPRGPDNFMTPAQYDGRQPTHFREVPEGHRRYFCVFSINVPMDSDPIFWTIRHRGRMYSVPGHTGTEEYVLDNLRQPSQDRIAPVIRFVEPASTREFFGRREVTQAIGPLAATVGTPINLGITAEMPTAEEFASIEPKPFRIMWAKYSGPGEVTFSAPDTNLEAGQSASSTDATFSLPGSYRLLLQGVHGNFNGHCCWTTSYVDVDVR